MYQLFGGGWHAPAWEIGGRRLLGTARKMHPKRLIRPPHHGSILPEGDHKNNAKRLLEETTHPCPSVPRARSDRSSSKRQPQGESEPDRVPHSVLPYASKTKLNFRQQRINKRTRELQRHAMNHGRIHSYHVVKAGVAASHTPLQKTASPK